MYSHLRFWLAVTLKPFCNVIMKLKELIGELQRLEKLNPDADAHFQLLTHNGNTRTALFVEAADINGQLTISITEAPEFQAVRTAPVD